MLAGVSVAPAQKGGSSTKNVDLVDGKRKMSGSSTKMADLVDGKGKRAGWGSMRRHATPG